jgi:hypothetical protein
MFLSIYQCTSGASQAWGVSVLCLSTDQACSSVCAAAGRAGRRAWPHPGASVPAAKHVHLYVLLLVGGRDAAHGRHQVPQYWPSMFICMCCCW